MYSSEDLEKLWFLYKLEGQPKNLSIESFCTQQGVSYQAFYKWFVSRKKAIVPVEIVGMPQVAPSCEGNKFERTVSMPETISKTGMLVESVVITLGTGLQISKNNPISCDDMSDSEKNSFIQFLVAESHKKDQQIGHLQQTIDAQGERLNGMQLTLDKIESILHATRDENLKLNAQLSDQGRRLKSMQSELKKALREADKYKGLYEVLRDEKFIGSSQKKRKSVPASGRDDDKDDWDGTGNVGEYESNSETESVTYPETNKECSVPGTNATVDMLVELVFYSYMPLPKGDLLTKALYYLKNAWTPVMAYRNGTCKMGALSFYQFLKQYFTAFMEGRTDYENLTPAILGKTN